MEKHLGKNSIVLLGVGHTNAHILKMWRMKPIENSELICVSNFPIATYSGMMPGVLSGQYEPHQMEIDLVRLCQVNGARLVLGEVNGVDRSKQRLLFRDRAPLHYDVLSIGIGSVPTQTGISIDDDANFLRIKPMQTFLPRLQSALDNHLALSQEKRITITIVGAGIGGIETAFCLHARLQQQLNPDQFVVRIISGDDQLALGSLAKTEQLVRKKLEQAGIEIHSGSRVTKIQKHEIELSNGTRIENDIVLWATSAAGPPILRQFDLEKDDNGFIATRPTLQSVSDDHIFAVGDSGTILSDPTVKAGVYAVRQGPVLWDNLNRILNEQKLSEYQPQRSFLKLINTGDGSAIAEYKGQAFSGKWCWRWKDYIDLKFMRMYQNYTPMEMKPLKPDEQPPMRCVGCGGKISGASLESALSEIEFANNDQVVVGVAHPDDAAIIRTPNAEVTATTDFFASPVEDPFLFGRIAALNGTSDCYAMGARPFAALAMAQVPYGAPKMQRNYLVEMMAGAAHELTPENTAIVGGHSIEGPRMALGFTVLANQDTEPLLKSNLNVGDQLIVTKPLGTGALLAALPEGKCDGRWFAAMIDSMLLNNSIALEIAKKFNVSAMTDVTGFGLAGHLLEMLQASQLSASLMLDSVKLYAGFEELTRQGIESTLTIENRHIEHAIQISENLRKSPSFTAMFDPQTCGGLLIATKSSDVDDMLTFLGNQGFSDTFVAGTVEPLVDQPRITIK